MASASQSLIILTIIALLVSGMVVHASLQSQDYRWIDRHDLPHYIYIFFCWESQELDRRSNQVVIVWDRISARAVSGVPPTTRAMLSATNWRAATASARTERACARSAPPPFPPSVWSAQQEPGLIDQASCWAAASIFVSSHACIVWSCNEDLCRPSLMLNNQCNMQLVIYTVFYIADYILFHQSPLIPIDYIYKFGFGKTLINKL